MMGLAFNLAVLTVSGIALGACLASLYWRRRALEEYAAGWESGHAQTLGFRPPFQSVK